VRLEQPRLVINGHPGKIVEEPLTALNSEGIALTMAVAVIQSIRSLSPTHGALRQHR